MEYPSVAEFERLYAELPTPLYDELMEKSKMKNVQIPHKNAQSMRNNFDSDKNVYFSQLEKLKSSYPSCKFEL